MARRQGRGAGRGVEGRVCFRQRIVKGTVSLCEMERQ